MDARKDGIQQGLQQGKSLGLAEGSRQAKLETARILKQLGDSVKKIMDILGDGESVALIRGGSALLPCISGSGCAAGTVVLATAAACGEPALGSLCGLLAMGLASERAEREARGSGTFAAALVDALHRLAPEDFSGSSARWDLEAAI